VSDAHIAVAEIVIGGFVFWAFVGVVLMIRDWLQPGC
jgi:hypothetical protein